MREIGLTYTRGLFIKQENKKCELYNLILKLCNAKEPKTLHLAYAHIYLKVCKIFILTLTFLIQFEDKKNMLTYNPLKYTKPETLENKFKEGDAVCAKEDPTKKLVIRRYVDRIYYCKVQGDETEKELVYFERELI